MSVRSWVTGALVVALVAGCTSDSDTGEEADAVTSPLADCAGLDIPPGSDAADERAGGEPLPELTLECFTGGEPFALADLRGPAVVNLWASWCAPCREELPALQRYADQAAGQVHVLGVVTEDRRSAAVSLAEELGITFPALDDPDGRLWAAVATVGLPTTLFVGADGQVRYVHTNVLDEQAVERYVTDQLGVAR
jgi:thiol-disulfide isomerase/thioredoxin